MPKKEPLILALDTSSKFTSLAVAQGRLGIASFGAELGENCSEKLWTEIDSLLSKAGLKLDSIELFSVCVGPGRFTGLRVGIAAVKGLAMATERPIVGSTSLEAIAFAAGPSLPVLAMINAHRGDVYWQLFSFDECGIAVPAGPETVSTIEAALERVAHIDNLVLSGDACENSSVKLLSAQRRQRATLNWFIKPPPKLLAETLAQLACLKLARGQVTNAAELRAVYVRPAEAEIKSGLLRRGSS
jgi:tRNA threonylcarbamoyladenosine biosynthesis protein TsaB